jgi:hypothetical protein
MRKLVLATAAAGALAGAMLSAPALATPISNLGALNPAVATLSDVEQAAIVCGRWRCWHTYPYYRPYYRPFYRPYYRRYWR